MHRAHVRSNSLDPSEMAAGLAAVGLKIPKVSVQAALCYGMVPPIDVKVRAVRGHQRFARSAGTVFKSSKGTSSKRACKRIGAPTSGPLSPHSQSAFPLIFTVDLLLHILQYYNSRKKTGTSTIRLLGGKQRPHLQCAPRTAQCAISLPYAS